MKLRSLFLALSLALTASPATVPAHDGHDHGDAPAVAGANSPRRLPDGSVFLPKPSQRQMTLRTLPVETKELALTVELTGKVVIDPNAGGKVQAMLAGRIEPGPRGLPSIGQRVSRGEVLAYVAPASGAIERSNQAALLAELRASRALAEKRLARVKELADTIPRKEIEAAESELASIDGRIKAVSAGLSSRDALVAPVSGVIASSHVAIGQVVDARELVFEVVDPARVQIEALAYDPALAAGVASATLAVGDERVPLRFAGAARALREQALPMIFTAAGKLLVNLAVGQPVRVYVQSATKTKGFQVPAASIMKDPSNQTIVWVKTAPEQFAPRVVNATPLDGVNVAATGLKDGDRVVTQGATLVNQVR